MVQLHNYVPAQKSIFKNHYEVVQILKISKKLDLKIT